MNSPEFIKRQVETQDKIVELASLDKELADKIRKLRSKVSKAGGNPIVCLPSLMGTRISKNREPLGSLETKMFALEKEIYQKEELIRVLERRLSFC